MQRSITGLLASQAYVHVKDAKPWYDEKNYYLEVGQCIVAQLLMGLSVEGVANELGEKLFRSWIWERLERQGDAAFKWWILSSHEGRTAFDPSAEPLQTVSALVKIRNALVHPKMLDFGDEIILQHMDGDVTRNVSPTQLMTPGDQPITPTFKLREEHGYNFIEFLFYSQENHRGHH